MYFCSAGDKCLGKTVTAEGNSKPGVISKPDSICDVCRENMGIPKVVVAQAISEGKRMQDIEEYQNEGTERRMREGRLVKVSSDGLPVDILEGSPFALIPD